jgi:hypothetical protein
MGLDCIQNLFPAVPSRSLLYHLCQVRQLLNRIGNPLCKPQNKHPHHQKQHNRACYHYNHQIAELAINFILEKAGVVQWRLDRNIVFVRHHLGHKDGVFDRLVGFWELLGLLGEVGAVQSILINTTKRLRSKCSYIVWLMLYEVYVTFSVIIV